MFFKGFSRILARRISGLSRDLLAYDFLQEVNGTELDSETCSLIGLQVAFLMGGNFYLDRPSDKPVNLQGF